MFTKREQTLLHDPYFKIIREEEQFIEVQSLNTTHCWNVFKNQFEPAYKIKLYHKHKMSDKYYHEHSLCRTVAEAVTQIKDHDAYVLEKEAEVARHIAEASEKETRQLTVHRTSGYNYKATSTLMLKGDWLEQWGFPIGTTVDVTCEGVGQISIKIAE